jgi:hypothetical protein
MGLAESIGAFGDRRLAALGARIFGNMARLGTVVLRRVGESRRGERAVGRFLSNPNVHWTEIVQTLSEQTAERCADGYIVVAQDTTEINFSGREQRRRGLGLAGDGRSHGFFIHAAVAIEAGKEAVLGVLDVQLWTRSEAAQTDRKKRPLTAKEAIRWLHTTEHVAQRAAGAARVVVVSDREGDIYGVFARRPAGAEMIVRAAQDRRVEQTAAPAEAPQGSHRLFAQPDSWPVQGGMTVKVAPRKIGDKGREAPLAVRAGRVKLLRPTSCRGEGDPPHVELTLVDVREIDPQPDVEAVHWRLLTSLPADDLEQAQEVVRLYRLRWRIEQVFRALKNDGMQLPDSQVQKAASLINLAAIALGAAVRNIQLVDARDGSPRPATDVVDQQMIPAITAIGATLEGATERQKNLHPHASLAWLAWIVARLGGWNCYGRPPGPKTMQVGWTALTSMVAGYLLAHGRTDVGIP